MQIAIEDIYYFEADNMIVDYDLIYNKLKTPCDLINSLDLTKIIAKSSSEKSELNWDLETALLVSDLYRAFLYLCKNYPNTVIVPTREVDDFWHLHILDTRNYIDDCQKIFGYYLHHFPYVGLKGTRISEDQEDYFMKNTLNLIANHFPELIC